MGMKSVSRSTAESLYRRLALVQSTVSKYSNWKLKDSPCPDSRNRESNLRPSPDVRGRQVFLTTRFDLGHPGRWARPGIATLGIAQSHRHRHPECGYRYPIKDGGTGLAAVNSSSSFPHQLYSLYIFFRTLNPLSSCFASSIIVRHGWLNVQETVLRSTLTPNPSRCNSNSFIVLHSSLLL